MRLNTYFQDKSKKMHMQTTHVNVDNIEPYLDGEERIGLAESKKSYHSKLGVEKNCNPYLLMV
jgi:hypothetical protein